MYVNGPDSVKKSVVVRLKSTSTTYDFPAETLKMPKLKGPEHD